MLYVFFLIFAGLLGLATGSFINVLTLRWQPDKDNKISKILTGRSHCLSCGKTLRWFEIIPLISFLVLRGRCRYCHKKLSWQYPLIEGLTSLVFIGLTWQILKLNFFYYYLLSDPRSNFWAIAAIILWYFYAAVLISLATIDFRHYLLPDRLIFPTMGISFLANLSFYFLSTTPNNAFPKFGLNFLGPYANIINVHFNPFISSLLGAIVLSAFLFLIYALSRGKAMGFGDVKLAALIGLMLGLVGGIAALVFAFVWGAIISLIIVLTTKKKLKDPVPFGPFLTLGVASVIFLGEIVINFYLSIFRG